MTVHRYNFNEFCHRFIDDRESIPLLKLIENGLPAPYKTGPWIAGGAIRRTLIQEPLDSDIDYFFQNEDQLSDFKLEMEDLGARAIRKTEHSITYSVTVGGKPVLVQAITIGFYQGPEHLIDTFDFTITQLVWDGVDLYVGEYALWDLARRRLALHKLTYGVSTVRRLIKYTRQGFTACGGVLASILEETIANPETVHREVNYVD